MKIKELKRTVNVSWSPAEHYPSMLAAGSAAQQVDASFSSNSYLELYSLNLEDPSFDFEVKSSIQTQHKFQKLVWSGAGVIAGGCDGGLLEFYNADKLLNNASDALVSSSSKHNGHVSALDVNPYQKNLLASGASDSEIFIWDLNNTSQPMAPGNRSQPYDHVQGLAWNQQVQHILGSTFATRCLVWDLRKNEPIMKLSDSQSRTRWRALAWHPSVATQLCIASEDDQAPVIQLWDLRLAASPLATLEGHNSGVLSLSWSRHDDDLLLSAGKDGRLLAWNPNNTRPGGEIVSEVSREAAWLLQVAWSAREAGLLAAAGFDHALTLHSLLPCGTSKPATSSNILDSFDGVEGLRALPALRPAPAPARRQPARAPKWLRRPVGGRFAFGGKLVTFEKCSQEAGSQKLVHISQVVSEPDIVEKASELDNVIALTQSREPGAAEKLAEYCRAKGDASSDQHERYMWFFLRSSFLPSFREDVLNMLGFKQDDVPSKFKGHSTERAPNAVGLSRGESTETEAELSTDTSTDLSDAQTLIERKMANVELDSFASNIVIPNGDDNNSLICRALVTGNFEEAVDLCIEGGRVADALVIASLGGPELVQKAQNHHFQSTRSEPVSLVASAVARASWGVLVRSAAPACWPRTLAALLRHAGEPPHAYCDLLGDKLSEESDPQLQQAASLCYVCAANADALAARALRASASAAGSADSAAASASVSAAANAKLAVLAQGVELALLVRSAAAVRGLSVQQQNTQVDALLTQYASRLAAQGCLRSALSVMQGSATDLASRVARALGEPQAPGYAGLRQQHPHQQQHHQHHQQQHSQQQQHIQHASRSRTVSSHSQRQYGGQTDNSYNAAPAQEVPSWSAAPPRPPSVASQSGGITSRSKYKVDPSVQSAPSYNQYSFNNPIQNQPSYGYNSPYPDQYNASSVPSHNFAPINQPNTINPLNTVPVNPLNPVPLNPLNPVPLNPLAPAPVNPVNQMNPAVNGNYYGQEATPAAKPAAPGWNDPPMMTARPKPKPEVQQQAPITHPLFGVEPPQHVPLVPTQYPGQNQFPGQNQYPGQQNQYSGQQNQYPGQIGQPAQFPGQQNQCPGQMGQFPGQQGQYPGQYQEQYPGQYPPGQQPGYPQQVESPAPVEAPAPIQKGPIPEQHAILQTVFDDLRNACSERAVNVPMKRKLEDVQRKLENLYDMLRENRLSESALSSLHSCVPSAQAGDHESALQVVTALATGSDFSAVASFLPGLKILFLLAAQLQVRSSRS